MVFRFLSFFVCVFSMLQVKANIKTDSILQGAIYIDRHAIAKQPTELSCLWEFYPNELLSSQEMDTHTNVDFIRVPQWWHEEGNKPGVQFASYRLKIIATGGFGGGELALAMPDVYSSYDLWVDGRQIGGNGKVGKSFASTEPQWKPDTYSFRPLQDTVEIILHISNFHHYRTGIGRPIVLGNSAQLFEIDNSIKLTDMVLLAVLGALSLVGFLYFVNSKKTAFLFYPLLCISWMIRSAFSNHYQIVQWFPEVNWNLVVRTEYMGIYLSTLFGSLLLSSLFAQDVNKLFRNFFILASSCFTLFTLLLPPRIFTEYVQFYLGLSSLLLISIFVIVLKAYVASRRGSGFLLVTAVLTSLTFGYVILSYQGFFQLNEFIFNGIFIIQFILLLVTIVRRVKRMGRDKEDYDRMTFDNYKEPRP